ncbi:MAG: RagB/SusD family nutrient uptake outer membrane protein [Prevotellaceae bacterium]|jgi:hypothetical protein|nr:RagB/SusD family nutrient uptake outer membrane protein [Prevotellaceae bacterium]
MKVLKHTSKIMLTLLTFAACNVDPEYHSETSPGTFYDSPERVYQRVGMVLSSWATDEGGGGIRSSFAMLQEFTTDEICMPARGSHWLDGGYYTQIMFHSFTPTLSGLNGAWNGIGTLVANAWNVKEDLDTYVDFAATFPTDPNARAKILLQLDMVVASAYLRAIDFFGGYPIFRSNSDPVTAKATPQELFNFIDSLLTNAMDKLPARATVNTPVDGYATRGAAAAMKARLYFNAKAYTGTDKYGECAALCKEIIDGKYGPYELATDYRDIFGWGNETCTEIIWGAPSTNALFELDPGNYPHSLHYNAGRTLRNLRRDAYNGHCLTPSLDGDGKSYMAGRPEISGRPDEKNPDAYMLGCPFAKFEDTDVRKQQYVYQGGGKYKGMFMMGYQENCLGILEYKDSIINLVDQIAYMSRQGKADFKEGLIYGEENSGIRLMKFSPIPAEEDISLWYNPDVPVIRLTEIYYTLAECQLRGFGGNKSDAAANIKKVRDRYFVAGENGSDGADPNPVTASNLDDEGYRMLDEWMIEFIGEKRRRTDLVRWGKFTTEKWFDHKDEKHGYDPGGKLNYRNKFPIPEAALIANPLLEQNEGDWSGDQK